MRVENHCDTRKESMRTMNFSGFLFCLNNILHEDERRKSDLGLSYEPSRRKKITDRTGEEKALESFSQKISSDT